MTVSYQLLGTACGHHGPYSFYRTFQFSREGKTKEISLGEFFFLRFADFGDVFIGELQLLWEDSNSRRKLCTCRLYLLPDSTPDGRRHEVHGQDEVLALSEKVVLYVEDLVQWIVTDIQWEHGLKGIYGKEDSGVASPSSLLIDRKSPPSVKSLNCSSESGPLDVNSHVCSSMTKARITESEETTVRILTYPIYCRYRTVLKRLENVSDSWMRNELVEALGGFTVSSRNCRLLFCRDTFEHPILETYDIFCNHLAPNLKGRPRKKRLKGKRRSQSPSSESNESEEWSSSVAKSDRFQHNGIKKALASEDLDEQEFLQKLFNFMRKRNTPIERVPHLGFKQINLYFFYKYAQNLGGYEKITLKKLWKHIYDELGGNPKSTSAATCTRRHYERLLLPYERHVRNMPKKSVPSPLSLKCFRKNSTSTNPTPSPGSESLTSLSAASDERRRSVEESPSEARSVCSQPEDEQNDGIKNVADIVVAEVVLDDEPPFEHVITKEENIESNEEKLLRPVTISLPPPLQSKVVNHQQRQQLTPLPLNQQRKRTKDNRIAEKERMWDEIRRQNALERDRIRQLSAVARTCGGTRAIKAKDLLSKPMGIVNPLEATLLDRGPSPVADRCQYSGGGIARLKGFVSRPSSIVSGLPGTKRVKLADSRSDSNSHKPSVHGSAVQLSLRPRLTASPKDSFYESSLYNRQSVNGQYLSDSMQHQVSNGWKESKESKSDSGVGDDTLATPRPSVIQHTHMASSGPISLSRSLPPAVDAHVCSNNVPPCDIPMIPFNGMRRGTSLSPPSLPVSHSNLFPPSHFYSYKPPVIRHNSPVLGDPVPSKTDRNLTFNYNSTSPLSNRHSSYRPLPNGPWSVMSCASGARPTGQTCPSLYRPGESMVTTGDDMDDAVVLDLSVKKPKQSPSPESGSWTNGEDRELDLSVKSSAAVIQSSALEFDRISIPPKQSNKSIPVKPLTRNSRESSYRVPIVDNHLSFRTSSRSGGRVESVSPVAAPPSVGALTAIKSEEPSSSPPALHVIPPPYYACDGKAPSFFPEYSSQVSSLLPPPSQFYGLPFSVSGARPPPLILDQMHTNVAAYKEFVQKNVMFSPTHSYPSYAYASQLCPGVYKDQRPYLYLPK